MTALPGRPLARIAASGRSITCSEIPKRARSGPGAGTTGSASLSWTASAEPDLNGYRVYYGTDSGIYIQGNAQGINVGNRTSFVVDGLNRGRRYFFAITAYDTRGNESAFSREQFKDIP